MTENFNRVKKTINNTKRQKTFTQFCTKPVSPFLEIFKNTNILKKSLSLYYTHLYRQCKGTRLLKWP